MKKLLLVCLLLLTLVTVAAAQTAVTVKVLADRPDGMYKCGEQVTFAITAAQGTAPLTQGDFTYTLTVDGARQISAGQGQLGEQPATVQGTLTEPGVLRCTVTLKTADKPLVALGGAAFEPEKIQPTATEPADFMQYWEAQKAALRAIAPDVQLNKLDQFSNDVATVYEISFACINGTRISGYLGVPVKEGKYPALLTVPAAGYKPYGPGSVWMAKNGYLAMCLYAHDYPLNWTDAQYEELRNGALSGYPTRGRESRDTYYFRRVFMGCTRFMDYLIGHPQWDGQTLIVTGSSQGGALSLICAGLEPRVTAIASNVPALCDHTGSLHGRPSGWPRLIPGTDANITQVSAYFDAVNFARHTKCTTLMGVGLIDTTCAAMSVYSAFNVLSGPKRIIATPTMGHSQSPEYSAAQGRFFQAQGKLQ